MAVSDEGIRDWFKTNQGASDIDISKAMGDYGVSSEQMSGAMGWDADKVAGRYDTATGLSDWMGSNVGATDQDIAQYMTDEGMSQQQLSQATGWGEETIAPRYEAAMTGLLQDVQSSPGANDVIGGMSEDDVRDLIAGIYGETDTGGGDVDTAGGDVIVPDVNLTTDPSDDDDEIVQQRVTPAFVGREYAAPSAEAMTSTWVNRLLAEDSDYLRRAESLALQRGASRGLLNYSMMAESGTAAAIDKAQQIGSENAATVAQAELAHQGYLSQGALAEYASSAGLTELSQAYQQGSSTDYSRYLQDGSRDKFGADVQSTQSTQDYLESLGASRQDFQEEVYQSQQDYGEAMGLAEYQEHHANYRADLEAKIRTDEAYAEYTAKDRATISTWLNESGQQLMVQVSEIMRDTELDDDVKIAYSNLFIRDFEDRTELYMSLFPEYEMEWEAGEETSGGDSGVNDSPETWGDFMGSIHLGGESPDIPKMKLTVADYNRGIVAGLQPAAGLTVHLHRVGVRREADVIQQEDGTWLDKETGYTFKDLALADHHLASGIPPGTSSSEGESDDTFDY